MNKIPSWDEWLAEAKTSPNAAKIGIYLSHTGVVREDSRTKVREGANDGPVISLELSYDEDRLASAIDETCSMPGIFYVKAWINEGRLKVGEDMMHVLVGGDIRPHVFDALDYLIGQIKSQCVTEIENK